MAVPNYETIPEHWKAPFGPYRQAPGGNWWYVSPFTGPEPWKTQGGEVEPPSYPDGFIDTFGERPRAKDFPKFGVSWQQALSRWKIDMEKFEGVARDPRVSNEEWENARRQFLQYGMGEPMPYVNGYGYWIRFPQSAIPWYEIDGISPQVDVGHEIARYQITLILSGEKVDKLHFFVPPGFSGGEQ